MVRVQVLEDVEALAAKRKPKNERKRFQRELRARKKRVEAKTKEFLIEFWAESVNLGGSFREEIKTYTMEDFAFGWKKFEPHVYEFSWRIHNTFLHIDLPEERRAIKRTVSAHL